MKQDVRERGYSCSRRKVELRKMINELLLRLMWFLYFFCAFLPIILVYRLEPLFTEMHYLAWTRFSYCYSSASD